MKKRFYLLLLCLLVVLGTSVPNLAATPPTTIYYVKISGSDAAAGTDWTTAFATLQKALSVATSGNQIWVAAGTYYPDEGGSFANNDRNASFSMKNGLTIYGGFVGNEPTNYDLSLRNFTTNATILSGDIDKNDGANLVGSNSFHVVRFTNASAQTRLDGFVIKGGLADDAADFLGLENVGGGIYNLAIGSGAVSSPTLTNLVITENSAGRRDNITVITGFGGGIANVARNSGTANPTLTDVLVSQNTGSAGGGGMYNFGDGTNSISSPVLTNVTLTKNTTSPGMSGNGGGISNVALMGGTSSPMLTNVLVSENVSFAAGGGMNNQTIAGGTSSPVLTNVTITQNEAGNGAGIHNNAQFGTVSPTLTDVVLSHNRGSGLGGGLYNEGSNGTSSPVLTRVTIIQNTAGSGGGIYNLAVSSDGTASMTLTSVLVSQNASFGAGGGIHNRRLLGSSNPVLTNVTLTNNTAAGSGGGIYIENSSPTLTGVLLSHNTASIDGGGMYIVAFAGSTSSPVLTNVTLTQNSAQLGGGIFCRAFTNNFGSGTVRPILTGVLLSQNTATSNGGGLYNLADNPNGSTIGISNPVLTNVAFANNRANAAGGAIYNTVTGNTSTTLTNVSFGGNSAPTASVLQNGSSPSTLTNAVIYGNTGGGAFGGTGITVGFSLLESSIASGYTDGGNNLTTTTSPFVSTTSVALTNCSPAINAGDPATTSATVGTTDLVGQPRFFSGGTIDMGAIEFQATLPITTLYVNQSVTTSGDGTTWGTAFKTLQEALTAANSCASITQIWVAKGTYYPTADATGNLSPAEARTKTFVMKNNLAIYGGFPNDGTGSMANRNWTTNPTILSGEIQQDNDASNNSYAVIRNYQTSLTSTAVLDGFTITGGNALSAWGGGMLNFESSPSLSNITFSGNRAGFGGGMFNHNSSPSLSNVTFSGNSAEFGGGMFNEASTAGASLSNVTFLGNSATKGGGMFNTGTSPSLTNCSFLGNVAEEGGGGMYNSFSSLSLTNCTFSGNVANDDGGGMFNTSSSPSLTNCTFSGNVANGGGGMYNSSPFSLPSLKNSILWGNSSEVANDASTPTYTNCLVQGLNPAGTGNLDGTNAANNPLFVSQPPVGLGTTGNLRLQACSPAINVGNDANNSTMLDLAGNDRKFGTIDLGAYEYQGNAVAQPTASASTTTAVICAGSTINLSASGGDTYSWNGPSGSNYSSTAQNPSFTGSSTSYSGLYTVVVSNTGCTATATATVSVQVNPNPVSTPSSNSPVCTGQTLQLNATAGGGTYSWSATGYSSGQQNPNRSPATTAMSGVYKLTVISNSCTTSATISVQVVSQATASISPSTTQTICQGQPLNLTASGGSPYSWSGPSFNSTNAIANINTSSTGNSGIYKVLVGSGVCTATATVSVQINPSITVSVSFAPVCLVGNPLNLSASGGDEYRWRGPNSFTSTSATPTKAKTVAKDEGIYSVTVTGNGVCTATSTIRVFYGIGAGGISITNRSPYCKGGPIGLTATAAGASSYQWTKQFGTVNFTGNPVTITNNAKTSDGGVYIVFVTGQNGCIEKQETLVTVSPVACIGTRLATEEAEDIDMQINAYPNPVSNTLTVEVTLQKPSKLSLKLFNSIGKESGTWQLNEEATFHKTELNMSELTGGVYLLQAQAGKQKVVKRVVKIQY